MESFTSRMCESMTGSNLFSLGSAAVRSSCGMDERMVAIVRENDEGRERRAESRLDLHNPSIINVRLCIRSHCRLATKGYFENRMRE